MNARQVRRAQEHAYTVALVTNLLRVWSLLLVAIVVFVPHPLFVLVVAAATGMVVMTYTERRWQQ